MRLLVCGDRHWDDAAYIAGVLDAFHAQYGIDVLIEGEAHGADRMAAAWARKRHVLVLPFPADWAQHGRAAGIVRNNAMLKHGRPDAVLAFHRDIEHSKGTADMVRRARKAGLPVSILPDPLRIEAAS